MARRESYIETKVCEYAARLGWRQRKMSFVGRRGCPDRWFQRAPGQQVIIEFKDRSGALSAHQRRELNWLRANGFHAYVIDSIEEGQAVFDSWGPPPGREEDI